MATCIHGVDLSDKYCDVCFVNGDLPPPEPLKAEVRQFTGVTRHSLTTELVLDKARNAGLDSVTVIGYDSDGQFYFASTEAGGPSVLWDLQKAIHKLMEVGE